MTGMRHTNKTTVSVPSVNNHYSWHVAVDGRHEAVHIVMCLVLVKSAPSEVQFSA